VAGAFVVGILFTARTGAPTTMLRRSGFRKDGPSLLCESELARANDRVVFDADLGLR
jgi:hypothetical protein